MKKRNTTFIALLLCTATLSLNAQDWHLLGNAGTNASTHFVGTTDAKPLVFRTNNTERMRILPNGRVGIGTKTPQALFNVPVTGSVTLTTTDNFLLGNTASS